ncbi:MAG: SDR family oxidoreductase, partial [Mycobacterium sp.]|nr:SDR family oxidoreductase [Mycobacterium sp.]
KRVLRSYPVGRLGEPIDPAALITFLASDAASWITAQTYPVNGGYSVGQCTTLAHKEQPLWH